MLDKLKNTVKHEKQKLDKTGENQNQKAKGSNLMKKFTFIMDFKGGTYISQVISPNIHSAMQDWANNLNVNEIKYIGEYGKRQIIDLLNAEEAQLLNGMDNVWCFAGSIKSGFFICNVVMS